MLTEKLSRNQKLGLLACMPIYFIVAGFIIQPFPELIEGIWAIIVEPDLLITDYFVIGGIGAAFVNAGVLTLISLWIIYKLDVQVDGHTITSTFLMFGFSLFGKNILNIWTILLGVYIYAHYHKTHMSRYIYVGFYGTSLSPIITQVMQIGDLSFATRVFLSIFTGIIIGFVLPPLATHVHYAHKGYSLYNVGFAGGVIATIIASIFKSFEIPMESRLIWSEGNNVLFLILLNIIYVGMIAVGLKSNRKRVWIRYRKILRSTGHGGTDYLDQFGASPTMLNMGINGIIVTAFVVLVGGDLNGPTIGSIFTVLGFSATGKHARNILPIMMGVALAGALKYWDITDPSAILALILSTTLAPIAGHFGVLAGILAGFIHSSVALNIGIIYSGMNLYNNGFAGGLVAIFLVPVIQSFIDRRARARGELPL